MDAVTLDSLFDGALRLEQPALGHRTSIDAVLLSAFAACGRGQRILDLGAGVGAVALCLYHFGIGREVHLIESDADLCHLAERNLACTSISSRVHCIDLALEGLPVALAGRADLVVSNPPFFEPGSARPPLLPQRRRAAVGTLSPFLRAAFRALSPRGRACFAYPASSLPAFFGRAAEQGLMAKRLRLVHASAETPARLALIELKRGRPGGLVVEPPWIEWSARGVRSPELTALVAGTLPLLK